VRAINTADAKFDPHLHQAIAEVPADGKPAGSIVDVVQSGYVISDRLLRPAMVTVARGGDNSDVKDAPTSAQHHGN
jgi:molecular chaperone GrpE